jgi:hypothetical protein
MYNEILGFFVQANIRIPVYITQIFITSVYTESMKNYFMYSNSGGNIYFTKAGQPAKLYTYASDIWYSHACNNS